MPFPWGDNRRFSSDSNYFKHIFGIRVQKLTIDAGFTCPNRDGTVSTGGCTYCNNNAFNPSYCNPQKSISQQISEGIVFHTVRNRHADKYLAYFQAYSNTHGSLTKLKQLYSEALQNSNIIGLVIGTRPDCVDTNKLDFIEGLSHKHYIMVEYGVESCYNQTLEQINRGHTFEKAVWAIEETAKRGIRTGAHIIFGLPGETRQQMLYEAKIISQLPLQTIKLHQLQIIKDTPMARQYAQNPKHFNLFSLEEYFDFIIEFLEHLNPNIVVERFTNETPLRFLVSPPWGKYRTDQLMVMLEKRLEERDTWQGKKF